ncbi:MAG: endonuclease Q family protein [Candidatus Pacearchaeota archaeon]|nr:endonuclease Q family protein [Candidatus Pacearchaeota archaeon]
MEIIADLQIHSRFARATSKDITLDNLEKYARIKGLNLLGTGDFQHPLWNREIKEKLKEDDKGILWSENRFPFIWQTEVSLMFLQGGKRRAVHLLIFAPNTKVADKIVEYLGSKGRLDYDGRPIFGMSCEQIVKDLKDIDDKIEIVPAHCMTPWFGLYGSDSGFDSLGECFGNQSGKIYAVESGMSADPSMLWRFKENVNVVSFSDAHSFWPWRIGREATIFEISELSYDNIINAIRTGSGLKGTIETPPEYGKYHYDGHRNCNFSCSPEETKKLNGICPVCGKKMTIGVYYRVEEIAKEKNGYRPKNARPFFKLIPLHELIAASYETTMASKKAWALYNQLIERFGNEFNILLNSREQDMVAAGMNSKLISLILEGRESRIKVKPGYDGVYGQVLAGEKQGKLL